MTSLLFINLFAKQMC